MKNVLVTGSNGFVGRHMVAMLKSRGWSVKEWDLPLHDVHRRLPVVTWKLDLVVHLAYHVGGRKAIDGNRAALAANLRLDAEMFEWAVRTKQGRFLYFSSSAAYPVECQKKGAGFLTERLAGAGFPDADYGWAKLTGERLAANARVLDLPVTVVRPFSGYAADQSPDYPFPSFVERAKRKESPFTVWGDPTSNRDWIHVDDVCAGALAVAEAGCDGPVNLCTGRATSMAELAGLCMRQAGYQAEIAAVPGSPYGVHTRVGDPTRMLNFYTPKVTIEGGVREAFK